MAKEEMPQFGSTLTDMSITMHEMFSEFINAGFTRKEALYLVGQAFFGKPPVAGGG